jgi:Zn-dependent protease
MPNLAEGFLWYLAFLFSVVVHEASHALAAFKLGDQTAYNGGQVTLDPLPHIKREPFGTVVMPILSF